jgi:Ca2+-binding RTX toxin-like protein
VLYTGSEVVGDSIFVYGDLNEAGTLITDFNLERGQANDGDDIIDIGDGNSIGDEIFAFGQGGKDKVIGGIGSDNQNSIAAEERLYGGDGDDKVWAHNPGQFEDDGLNYLYGNNGNDIIYGSQGED